MASEIIDIRQFNAQDFKPLLDVESERWLEGLRWDFKPSRRLISSCLEEKRLPGYVLVLDRRIQGYSFFFYEGEKGLIGNLFLESVSAPSEHAILLLDHVVDTLLGTPGLHRVESQLPHFSFEQLENYFRGRSFEGYRRRFMAVRLADDAPLPQAGSGRKRESGKDPRVPEDFRLEPWERKHDHPAAQLLARTYRNHVDAAINDQYRTPAGSLRLIEHIFERCGCGETLSRVSLVAIHRPSQKLAGVLAMTTVRPRTAHIPQVAVANDFQGSGLGTAMMETAFQDLARQGFEEVSLTVTDSNAGAVRLYERMGFETFRTFGAFVWERS